MIKKIEEIKENKVLKTIGNILYTILFIIVILMLIVVILQRATDNSITIAGFRIFTVATGSMEPKYEIGDTLVCKEVDASKIEVGDDVVYKGETGSFKNKIITHQVVSIREENGEYKYITKGIANNEEDPEINQNQILGEIVYKIKTLSFIGKLISNLYIFYFLIFIPIAIIIFKQIKNIISDDEEDETSKEDDKSKK